jgi:hypothetical protein
MNIIQVQDRLKGLPEDALVNYVEQPMGEVPIYLALGELQRRKEMKERFQASQAEKPTISEQLVAEAKPMQMGLGAMAPQQIMPGGQGVGTPPPAPEMDPRQLAASGIAANPQSAVGGTAMMAKGGIVGEFTDKTGRSAPISEDGSLGFAGPGLALIPAASALISRLGTGLASQKVGLPALTTGTGMIPKFVQKGRELVPYVVPKVPSAAEGAKQGFTKRTLDWMKNNKGKTILGAGGIGGSLFLLGDNNEPIDIPDTIAAELSAGYEPVENLGRDAYAEQYLADLGTSETRDALTQRALEMQERVDKDRGDAGNMALIQAGLNIAAGQSPNAISNIATGATAGLQDYTKRLKDADKAELQNMKLQSALDEATRAEKRAAMLYGTQSEQFIDAQNTRLQVAEMTMNFNIQKQRAAIIDSIKKNDQSYATMEMQLTKQVNDGEITQANKDKQLNNYLESIIAQYNRAGGTTSTSTAPEGMTQIGTSPDGKAVFEDANGNQFVGE